MCEQWQTIAPFCIRGSVGGWRFDSDARVYNVEMTCTDGRALSLRARHVIVASGRFASSLPAVRSLATQFVRFEFGFRIETPASNKFFARYATADPKIVYQQSARGLQWRSFCMCRRGEIMTTRLYGMTTLSGRSDCEPTENSNFGFLVRVTDTELAAELAAQVLPVCRGDSVFDLSLVDSLTDGGARLAALWGHTATGVLLEGLRLLIAAHPELEDASARLRGPCLEGVGEYCALDASLSVPGTDGGVTVIGDASGIFRGIVPAMVSGNYAARVLTRRMQRAQASVIPAVVPLPEDCDADSVCGGGVSEKVFA